MRLRVWQSQGPRVLALNEDGPMAIDAGDYVCVVICKSAADANAVVAAATSTEADGGRASRGRR